MPDQVLVNRTTGTTTSPVPWDAEQFDTGNWHDNSTNPSRLTVPSGETLARMTINTRAGSSDNAAIAMTLSGAAFYGQGSRLSAGSDTGRLANAISAPVAVTGGSSYFEMILNSTSTVDSDFSCWAYAEVLDASLQYCLVRQSSATSIGTNTLTFISWDTEEADVGGWHSTGTNPSRMTVPSGVTLVRCICNGKLTSTSGGQMIINIYKNGATFVGTPSVDTSGSAVIEYMNAVTAVLEVTTGDYFEAGYLSTGANSLAADENSWFSIEEVPSTYKRALATKIANQSISAATPTAVTFTSNTYDTDSIHSTVTNTSRFTAPADVNEARISFNVLSPSSAGTVRGHVTKNGSDVYGQASCYSATNASDSVNGISAWIPCSAGDYFEIVFENSAAVTLASAVQTWGCAEFR